MPSAYVIAIVTIALGLLVAYAFIQQTIKNKLEQKARLTNSLKARYRNLTFILNGFPDQFLPQEISALLITNIINICEQLVNIEPQQSIHKQNLASANLLLVTAKNPRNSEETTPISSLQQAQEIKTCLEELHKFVGRQEEKQSIPKNHAQHYRSQIKHMATSISVDSYCLKGEHAKSLGKTKLSLHYAEAALNTIAKQSKENHFRAKVDALQNDITSLQAQLAEEERIAEAAQTPADKALNEQWDDESADASWKKKKLYD